MTNNVPKAVRATLKALWREFKRCSYIYPPLYSELWRPTNLFQELLSQHSVKDVYKAFRKAFADHFQDNWEEWDGSDDVSYFCRYFGSGEGLVEFKNIAESTHIVICEIWPGDPELCLFNFQPNDGYHGWIKLMASMAFGFPTPLLRCEHEYLGKTDHAVNWDIFEQFCSLKTNIPSSLLSFSSHRFIQSVFTSSMTAIELILDQKHAMLVGDMKWNIPVVLSVHEEVQTVDTSSEQKSTEVCTIHDKPEERLHGPVRVFKNDGCIWQLEFDTGNKKLESGKFPDQLGFGVYREILQKPDTLISPIDLLVATKQIEKFSYDGDKGQDILDYIGIDELRSEIKEIQKQIDDTVDEDQQKELEEKLASLISYKKQSVNEFGNPRKFNSPLRKFSNRLFGQMLRARENQIAAKMPKFAAYLRKSIKQKGTDFIYSP